MPKIPSLDEWRSKMLLACRITNQDSEMLKGAIKEHEDKVLRIAKVLTKMCNGDATTMTAQEWNVVNEAMNIVQAAEELEE